LKNAIKASESVWINLK